MQTFRVVEGFGEWRVEFGGEIVFKSPTEEACFLRAIAASSELFDDGVKTQIEMARLLWDDCDSPLDR